jgi:hypothetical protein
VRGLKCEMGERRGQEITEIIEAMDSSVHLLDFARTTLGEWNLRGLPRKKWRVTSGETAVAAT